MSAEELAKQVEDLTKKYADAMNELQALKESASPTPVSSSQPATSSSDSQKNQLLSFLVIRKSNISLGRRQKVTNWSKTL